MLRSFLALGEDADEFRGFKFFVVSQLGQFIKESRIGGLLCQNQQEIFTSNCNISGSWIVE